MEKKFKLASQKILDIRGNKFKKAVASFEKLEALFLEDDDSMSSIVLKEGTGVFCVRKVGGAGFHTSEVVYFNLKKNRVKFDNYRIKTHRNDNKELIVKLEDWLINESKLILSCIADFSNIFSSIEKETGLYCYCKSPLSSFLSGYLTIGFYSGRDNVNSVSHVASARIYNDLKKKSKFRINEVGQHSTFI